MSKLSHRKIPASAPNAAQVAAVRRLLDSGNPEPARQRLSVLRKSFPDFKPLLGLAWEVEDRFGHPMIAAARAYDWHQASPNSQAAAEALCKSAQAADLVAVFGYARQHLAALTGEGKILLSEFIEAPLGVLTQAQARAIDLSRMHMADKNPAAVIAVLQGVDHPSARNNLALALFFAGNLPQALAVSEANWQAGPDNLFALNCIVRWRCWTGGLNRSLGFAAPLRHTRPLRAEDAVAQVSALRFLGDDQAALLAWNAAKDAPYWSEASQGLRQVLANLQASEAELPGNDGLWFPGPLMNTLNTIATQFKKQDPQLSEQPWEAMMDSCDAHVDYLIRAVDLGDTMTRTMALSVLKRRAGQSDAPAQAGLKALLTHPNGPDQARIDLLNWLIGQGLHPRHGSANVWVRGSVQKVKSYNLNITDKPRPSALPPDGKILNQRVHEAIGRNDLHQALDLALQLDALCPNLPSPLTHLAALKEALGHDEAEVMRLYERVQSLAPDNVFARCGLSRSLARQGQLEAASNMLDGLLEREEFHRSEYKSLLMAQRTLALAHGDQEAVRTVDETLRSLAQL